MSLSSLAQRGTHAGAATIEFALVLPVLLQLIGVFDFAMAFWTRGVLASSVAEGAQYAVLVGPSVTAANIKSVVAQKLSIPTANIAVSGPSCYCISGAPAAAAAALCSSTCPNGSSPGTYVTVAAQTTYQPLMPLYSRLGSTNLQESAMVRLQ